MTTGRALIEAALREPLLELGWAPRAAGWFTRPVAPGAGGVIVVGVASKRTAAGTGAATLYVHLCDEQLEAEVAHLTGTADTGYRTTTSTTSIGYLMPDARWHEWHVTPTSVDTVAVAMASAVRAYAEPHLRALAADPRAHLAAIAASPASSGARGLARTVLLLRRLGEGAEAAQFLGRRMTALTGRTDAVATEERRVAVVLASQPTAAS